MLLPEPGDVVWIRRRRWRVERAERQQEVVRLDVQSGGRRMVFLEPFDLAAPVRTAGRYRRARLRQAAARLAGLMAQTGAARLPVAAVRARIRILPHQLEPALAFADGDRRVLIADGVGLGKTIQAALVIADRLRDGRARRVLVLVPAALMTQWADELTTRFGLAARLRHGRTHDGRQAGVPEPGVWIASTDYVKQDHVLPWLLRRAWDLVVVDEAHTATGDSERHRACDEIGRRARAVLLLTATPHGGDRTRFAQLLGLGSRGHAADRLTIFRRTRNDIAQAAPDRRVRWHGVSLSAAERIALDALTAFEHAVLRRAAAGGRDAALLLLSVFRKRAMSTMGALAISLERRLSALQSLDRGEEPLWRQGVLFDPDAEADLLTEEERGALLGESGLPPAHERSWLRRLLVLARKAAESESKARRVVTLCARTTEPVAVFTEFRDSLRVLEARLRPIRLTAVVHGGQTPAEQQRALRRFLDGPATALLATDVASVGLNLQARARWVVSLELPWNPVRIEQRAGRVDRIGQRRPVHVTLLAARHPAEGGVLRRLVERAVTARRAFGDDLPGVVPDERHLRAVVLAGDAEPAVDDSSRPVPLCRRWERMARALGRSLVRRRRLAERWRTEAGRTTGVEICATTLCARMRSGRFDDHCVLVFSVPILESSGLVAERQVVAVVVPRPRDWRGAPSPRLIRAAQQVAVRRVEPRARRLDRLRRRAVAAWVDREDRSRDVMLESLLSPRAQLDLFGRRSQRAAGLAAREAAAVRRESTDEIDALRKAAVLLTGRPALELVLTGRR